MISFNTEDNVGWQILSIQIKNKDYLSDFVKESSAILNQNRNEPADIFDILTSSLSNQEHTINILA